MTQALEYKSIIDSLMNALTWHSQEILRLQMLEIKNKMELLDLKDELAQLKAVKAPEVKEPKLLSRPSTESPTAPVEPATPAAVTLMTRLTDLPFDGATDFALMKSGFLVYVGDLVQCTEKDLMSIKRIRHARIKRIKEVLALYNLHLGMAVSNWDKIRPKA